MIADVKINDYYLQFIHNAEVDAKKYEEKYNELITYKEKLIKYLTSVKDVLNNSYSLDLDKYTIEWGEKRFNPNESLYKVAFNMMTKEMDKQQAYTINQVLQYTYIIKKIYNTSRLIELTQKRSKIKFKTYREYLYKFYSKVHQCVLEGNGYKFGYGIGVYVCNYWLLDKDKMKHKPHLDFDATRKKKQEILDKGLKPYDDKEATWCKYRNIPYYGIDYRVYKENRDWYEITFIKSNLHGEVSLDYHKTEYLNSKYRGMSYTEIADTVCKTLNDVYNLQADIKYKLNILLYKNPNIRYNFIRNASQNKYDVGAHNC